MGAGILAIIMINMAAQLYFKRFDLTTEKRHTLTPETVEMIKNLDDVIFVRVFLEGDLPAELRRLRNAVKERLDEMRAYSDGNLEYQFINPSADEDPLTRKQTWQKLIESGLEYTSLTIQGKDGVEEKIVFPGALISYQGDEYPLQILKSRERIPSDEMLNNSINDLEYNLAGTIRQITRPFKPKIGFLEGHGEYADIYFEDFQHSVAEQYEVERVKINGQLDALLGFDALVIAGPDSAFSEKDKFVIDQYFMKNGKLMWLVDGMKADLDSLKASQGSQMMSLSNDLNLEDMLFTYGVRVNKDLLLDRSCAPIALTVGMFGDQPNMQLFPWFYNPVLISKNEHPIVTNIDPILTQFVSSIDIIESPTIKATPLLFTSEYTRLMRSPVRVNLGIVGIDPDFTKNTVGRKPVAVLLEGKFPSVFNNRIPAQLTESKEVNFKKESVLENKMIVVSDADVVKNPVNLANKQYYPLGFDKYAKKIIYGNKEFLLNAINYLMNDASLISVRSREIKLRKLNEELLLKNKTNYQVLNIVLPLLLIVVFAVVILTLRRRKYAR